VYLFWVEVRDGGAWHVFCQADGFVADLDGVQDDVLELVFGVAGAELARVGVHCEGHDDEGEGVVRLSRLNLERVEG